MHISRSRRIVVIQGHPDPSRDRFCHALARAYEAGAREGGHAVRLIDIATIHFPILRTQTDFETHALPPALAAAWDAIQWANHVVIVFPLWLGTMPALLKAFLEQVARPGYAFAYKERGFPTQLLLGRSARLVVTMGMPSFLYRFWYFGHGVRGLERSILKFIGIKPVAETLIGMIGACSAAKRERWLEKMRELGRKGQ
jgi:putative NADPH-quinone reductase